ncbi:MAG: FAD-dependent oxidoreductase [Planctomycetia bacterium]|nr:FAD-dependent oxidoreductase [Planctomycetia bacterium]
MSKSYDHIIVGGGIMGASLALQLTAESDSKVLLIEKSFPGAGSTGKSGAILRQHYSHPVTIAMAREGLQWYSEFEDRFQRSISFHRPGMAFICKEADRDNLERNVKLQRGLGVDTQVIDGAILKELEPNGNFAPDECAAWESEAGNVNPVQAVNEILSVAISQGTDVILGQRVTSFLKANEIVSGVILDDGQKINAGMVVICAGPWTGKFLSDAGIKLPLQALRPEQAFFEPPPGSTERRLIYGDLTHGLYWKPELAGWTRVGFLDMNEDAIVDDPDHYDEGVSGEFIQECRDRLSLRLPHYAKAASWGGVGALYTVTPDAHPVIGPVPGLSGAWVMSGFSGHGFKLAPAVSRGVASILGEAKPGAFDPNFFCPQRFQRGEAIEVRYGYGILG